MESDFLKSLRDRAAAAEAEKTPQQKLREHRDRREEAINIPGQDFSLSENFIDPNLAPKYTKSERQAPVKKALEDIHGIEKTLENSGVDLSDADRTRLQEERITRIKNARTLEELADLVDAKIAYKAEKEQKRAHRDLKTVEDQKQFYDTAIASKLSSNNALEVRRGQKEAQEAREAVDQRTKKSEQKEREQKIEQTIDDLAKEKRDVLKKMEDCFSNRRTNLEKEWKEAAREPRKPGEHIKKEYADGVMYLHLNDLIKSAMADLALVMESPDRTSVELDVAIHDLNKAKKNLDQYVAQKTIAAEMEYFLRGGEIFSNSAFGAYVNYARLTRSQTFEAGRLDESKKQAQLEKINKPLRFSHPFNEGLLKLFLHKYEYNAGAGSYTDKETGEVLQPNP